MHNIEFNNFYKKYFQNWSDIETMIFYMKLYKAIEYGYSLKFNTAIDPQLMTFTLHKVMTTTPLRKEAMKIFRNFKDTSISDKEIFCKLLDFTAITNEKLLLT
jgi:predicted lipase